MFVFMENKVKKKERPKDGRSSFYMVLISLFDNRSPLLHR